MLFSDSDRFEPDVAPAHPDGQPWRKACAVCAFRRSNPQGLTQDDFDGLYLEREFGLEFVCTHRTQDGYSRECACWAAINKARQRAD